MWNDSTILCPKMKNTFFCLKLHLYQKKRSKFAREAYRIRFLLEPPPYVGRPYPPASARAMRQAKSDSRKSILQVSGGRNEQ